VTLTLMTCADSGPRYDGAALAAFRAEREAVLLADDGWFTVAGLHFLRQGDNTVGSGPDNDLVLPYPDVPSAAAVIAMTGTTVAISAVDWIEFFHDGVPASEALLRLGTAERPPDTIAYGDMSFFLHYSGPRLAIRVRDQHAPLRTTFSGLKWFAPNPEYRTVGVFRPAEVATVVQAPNILGDLEPFDVAGTVTFELGGQAHSMEAWRSGTRLWFVFRDPTSADVTYPAARFLYTDAAAPNGDVVMDFNYARNPPCAYNPWTTCPLPPESNRLPVRVEAGELRYHPE